MFLNKKINIYDCTLYLAAAVLFLAPIRKLTTLFGFFSIQQFLSLLLILFFCLGVISRKLKIHGPLLLFLLFLFAFDIFLFLYHASWGNTLDFIDIFNRYKMWIFAYIVCVLNFTSDARLMFGRTVILSTLFASLLAIANYLVNFESLQILAFWDFRMFRAGSGLEYDTNYFAAIICMSIPFHFNANKYLNGFSFYNKKFNPFIISIVFLTLFLTLSRGAYIVSALFVAYYLYNRVKARDISFSSVAMTALVVFLSTIFLPTFYLIVATRLEDIFNAFTVLDSSLLKRVDSLTSAKILFMDNPIFGVGLGQSPLLSGSTGLIDQNRTFDNQYLTILVEQGMFYFLTYYFYLFYNIFKSIKDGFNEFNMSILAFFIFAFFYNIESLWYFYFLIGIIISQRDNKS